MTFCLDTEPFTRVITNEVKVPSKVYGIQVGTLGVGAELSGS